MTREEAIERFNGIINAMSISVAQSKFYPSKAELDELCNMAIEALSADAVEVVRCGECKHMIADGRCMEFADDGIRPSASDFCSYGERKRR